MDNLRHLRNACEQVQGKVAKKKRQIANVESLIASAKTDSNSIQRTVQECREFLKNCTLSVLVISPQLYIQANATLEKALGQQQDLEEFLACLEEAKPIAARLLQPIYVPKTDTKNFPFLP